MLVVEWYLGVAYAVVVLAILVLLIRRVEALERWKEFFDGLIRNSRAESRVANATAMQTQRLVNSVLGGAEARRRFQKAWREGGVCEGEEPGRDDTVQQPRSQTELLAERIRYRHSAEALRIVHSDHIQPDESQMSGEPVDERQDGEEAQNSG